MAVQWRRKRLESRSPDLPSARSQGATLDELRANLREVIAMLLEDGEPKLETKFVGTQTVIV